MNIVLDAMIINDKTFLTVIVTVWSLSLPPGERGSPIGIDFLSETPDPRRTLSSRLSFGHVYNNHG